MKTGRLTNKILIMGLKCYFTASWGEEFNTPRMLHGYSIDTPWIVHEKHAKVNGFPYAQNRKILALRLLYGRQPLSLIVYNLCFLCGFAPLQKSLFCHSVRLPV